MASNSLIIIFLFTIIISTIPQSHPLPLSTNNRWIIDALTGQRVKLACVNWPGATQTMLPEGLDRQPLRSIVASIRRMGFNCVRLTYATYMVTRVGPHARVGDTFDQLGLGHVKDDIVRYNPLIVRMSHLEAFDAVLDELGMQGVMVDLDNHVSKPMWCCAEKDGNGFFGDEYFDPKEWLVGLTTLARRYLFKPQVVGMGLRNELRGDRQNEATWRKYVTLAGSAIHAVNPNLLIFAGGISYASVLSFLKNKPEVPLFVGEVGIPGMMGKKSSDYFLSCFLSWAAENDLDWGWWGLQGDYYLRSNVSLMDEYFGVLSYFWDRVRNPFLMNRLRLMQFKNQGTYTCVYVECCMHGTYICMYERIICVLNCVSISQFLQGLL
ncbi:Glycosyl hydrolase 5 family protein [Linum perenne]